MKKVIVLAAIAAVFASCASDNKSNSGLLGSDSATVTVDSTVVDSVAFESMVQDTLTTN
jgi:PBP1b-binding outer membrane lipoprotein LpoB